MSGKRRYPERKKEDLSDSTKAEIRSRLKAGTTDIYQLAPKFKCSPS